MTEPARAGIVLAGGRSTRFGEDDKLIADVAGRPLLAHAIEAVAPAVDGVVVSCRRAQVSDFRSVFEAVDVPVAPALDRVPDRGPAVGLANALASVGAPRVAVVAGDMPFVDASFLAWLFEHTTAAAGAVPTIDGHRQPTHATFRRDALETVARKSVEAGDRSLRDVLDRLDVTIVPERTVRAHTDRRTFTDVNTVVELESAAAQLTDEA